MDSKVVRIITIPWGLFIIDDIIANESLDKRRQPLLELSISGRHRVTTNGYRRSPIRVYQKN